MSPKTVHITIEVNPSTKPRIRPVVAFPEDEVRFTSMGGDSTFFFPEGDQIFEKGASSLVVIPVEAGGEKTLHIKADLFNDPALGNSVDTRGALFVEYSVYCKNEGGEAYFAEGNSAPKIIIPKF